VLGYVTLKAMSKPSTDVPVDAGSNELVKSKTSRCFLGFYLFERPLVINSQYFQFLVLQYPALAHQPAYRRALHFEKCGNFALTFSGVDHFQRMSLLFRR
jgi:hypothetical protein